MSVDIKTELARRALLIIQDAISQNAVQVAVQQTKFLVSILAPEIEEWEESEKSLLEGYLENLDKKFEEFLNPKLEIENDVVPAELQAALAERKRRELANDIYSCVNDVVKKLIKNCRGVFG
ncbi:hypothetical protein ACO3UB_08425 (plasmid) [Methanocaldococcus sp. 16A]